MMTKTFWLTFWATLYNLISSGKTEIRY